MRARAQVVQREGDALLAAARLALDQRGKRRGGVEVDLAAQACRSAGLSPISARSSSASSPARSSARERSGARERCSQAASGSQGLGTSSTRAQRAGAPRVRFLVLPGEHEDAHLGRVREQVADQLEALVGQVRHGRQAQVDQREVAARKPARSVRHRATRDRRRASPRSRRRARRRGSRRSADRRRPAGGSACSTAASIGEGGAVKAAKMPLPSPALFSRVRRTPGRRRLRELLLRPPTRPQGHHRCASRAARWSRSWAAAAAARPRCCALIGGQLRPSSGAVRVAGEDGRTSSTPRGSTRLRRRMSMLFQFGALFTDMTVFENVAFPLREHTRPARRR